MHVRFDSLNRFEVPKFTLCNPGSVYRNGTTSNTIGVLVDTSDEEIVFNFNTPSQLNFRVNRIIREDRGSDDYVKSLFNALQNRRLIFVDNIGYFIITSVQKGYADGIDYKDITAESCEIEIQNKALTYIQDGTYQFSDLINQIIKSLPKWELGFVASSVNSKHRTFQDIADDRDTLSFMLEDMQDAYECIFVCDILNRRIDVYDQNDYAVSTDIHLTRDNFIDQIQVTENSADLYTAISVFGDENLNIAPINPLGTTVIYDFTHYLGWMTPALREKVTVWQTKVKEYESTYYDLNLDYYNQLTDLSAHNAELDRLTLLRSMYQQCRDNIVANSSMDLVGDYNDDIEDNGGELIPIMDEITDTLSAIDDIIFNINTQISAEGIAVNQCNADIGALDDRISAIHDAVSFAENFTDDEYAELCDYIYEGSYRDENIIATDIMTYSEKFEQMKTLYARAKSQLKKISVPTQEFSADVENFLFIPEFERWSEQLETGCLVNVELEQDDVAALFLTAITVNYSDCKLGMIFGNRFNRFDIKALYNSVLGGIKKSSNSIEFIKDAIHPITNGDFNEMQAQIANSRTLTMSSALASKNEEVTLDGSGFTGRQVLDDGSYDPRQVKITSKAVVFTNDSWQTAQVAIGEIIFDNDTRMYGINAKVIIGDLILGNGLTIKNNDGTDLFTAIDNRITSHMSSGYVTEENFAEVLRTFNSTIEADSEAVRQYYKFHSELNDDVTDISAYIHTGHVADDENGNPVYGLKLGREDYSGEFCTILTPQELAFYDTSMDKLAFLSNKKLNIGTTRTTAIEMTDNLGEQDRNKWRIDTSDGFSICWIGS